MTYANPHIIERISLDVRTDRGDYATHQAFTDWLRSSALPAIETLCDDLIPPGQHWRVDRMDLDLGRFRTLDLSLPGQRAALLERLLATLRNTLTEQLAEGHARVGSTSLLSPIHPVDASQRLSLVRGGGPFAAWLYFLEFGHLPWWAGAFPPAEGWAALLRERLTDGRNRRQLRELIGRSPEAVRRLVSDPRHEPAFRSTLALDTLLLLRAWERWVAARKVYEQLRPQLAPHRSLTREWVAAGKAFFWWVALEEKRAMDSAESLLETALATVFPDISHWPITQRERLAATLGIPRRERTGSREQPATRPVATAGDTPGTPVDPLVGADGMNNAVEASGKAGAPAEAERTEREEDPGERAREDGRAHSGGKPGLPREKVRQGNPDDAVANEQCDRETQPVHSVASAHRPGEKARGLPPPPSTLFWPDGESVAPAVPPPNAAVYYLHFAGVVLAHPFLAPLFAALGYWQDAAFADPLARQRAVFLTHYLATGERAGQEEDMLLPKLLCGWPVAGEPVRLTEPLTDPECHEADEVLRAVLGHWGDNGVTSPDGLRGGYFARDGRLQREENGWRVTVERRAQDILLGSLPWGISVVYAPWHERMINVEW